LGEHYSVISSQAIETLDDLWLLVAIGERMVYGLTKNSGAVEQSYFLMSLRSALS
jgi:hypothetical protein